MLTKKDIVLIKTAIDEGNDVWTNDCIKPIKAKIKKYHRAIQEEACCYCRRDTTGEFNMVLDIEHILPKSHPLFTKHMFRICNLSVACKRCNMKIKGKKINFIKNIESASNKPCESELFEIIHPNSDIYQDHITYLVSIKDDFRLIKYVPNQTSSKGRYTFDFFRLHELEREAIDEAQGVKNVKISDSISDEVEVKIEELFQS